VHYTDARADAPAELVVRELGAHLQSTGIGEAAVRPIPASIEDAFMWYMGQERAA
jgi:hypothetical protein